VLTAPVSFARKIIAMRFAIILTITGDDTLRWRTASTSAKATRT
jgi:hypothetical protein